MEQYNYVNEEIKVRPNYDLNNKEIKIKFYITIDSKVIIIGSNNIYIYWLSITDLYDKETNAKIFNYIATGEYYYISNENKVLEAAGLDYDILKHSYLGILTGVNKDLGWITILWETPFGTSYGNRKVENNGKFFANDIIKYYKSSLKRCEIREDDGNYMKILKNLYDKIDLSDYMNYEFEIKPIEQMLNNEGYLILSPNKEIRDLYFKCIELCISKYNNYQSVVR